MKFDFKLGSIPQLKDVLSSLPYYNYCTLKYLCKYLLELSAHSSINKMTTSNISIVFGPTVLKSPVDIPTNDASQLSTMAERILNENMVSNQVMASLLDNFAALFGRETDKIIHKKQPHLGARHLRRSTSNSTIESTRLDDLTVVSIYLFLLTRLCRSSANEENLTSSAQQEALKTLVDTSVGSILFKSLQPATSPTVTITEYYL